MSAAAFTDAVLWHLPEHRTDREITQGGRPALVRDLIFPHLVIAPRSVRIPVGPADQDRTPQLVYDQQHQEESMRFDYDAHYQAMRGDAFPGPTLDQQRRAARLAELRRLAVALMWTGAVAGALIVAVAVFELLSGRGG